MEFRRADSIASSRTDGSELDDCDSVDDGAVLGVYAHAPRGGAADVLAVRARAD